MTIATRNGVLAACTGSPETDVPEGEIGGVINFWVSGLDSIDEECRSSKRKSAPRSKLPATMECGLGGPPAEVLPRVAELLKR